MFFEELNQTFQLFFEALNQQNIQDSIKFYNQYIDLVATFSEVNNLWEHQKNHENILAPYQTKGVTQAFKGYAFIPQYRESTLIRTLYQLCPLTHKRSPCHCFYDPEHLSYMLEHPDAIWTKMSSLFDLMLKCIQAKEPAKELKHHHAALWKKIKKDYLLKSLKYQKQRDDYDKHQMHLLKENFTHKKNAFNACLPKPERFYHLDFKTLSNMSNDEVATIFFEEYDAKSPEFIIAIANSTLLCAKISKAFDAGHFTDRTDNPKQKIIHLENILKLLKTIKRFSSSNLFNEKINAYEDIITLLKQLPDKFQQPFQKKISSIEKITQKLQAADNIYSQLLNEFNQMLAIEKKLAMKDVLQKAYESLPDILQDKCLEEHTQCQAEIEFLTQLSDLNTHTVLNQWQATYNVLMSTFQNCPETLQKKYQETMDALVENSLEYELILNKRLLPADACLTHADVMLWRCHSHPELKEALLQDLQLWQAVAMYPATESLTETIVQDLLILKTFHDEKMTEAPPDEEYKHSLGRFYTRTMNIRLSQEPKDVQISAMKAAAHEEFHHRHSVRRLMADALICIGFLFLGAGLMVGLTRLAMNKSFFFSTAPTKREKDIIARLSDDNYSSAVFI